MSVAMTMELDDDDEADFDSPTAFNEDSKAVPAPAGFEKNRTSTDMVNAEPGARDKWVDEETNPGIGKSKSVLAKD